MIYMGIEKGLRKACMAMVWWLLAPLACSTAMAGAIRSGTPDFANTSPSTGRITITAVGDIMMGTTYPVDVLPPDDGKGIFDGVKRELQGDLVFGNLEGPLTDEGAPIKCSGKSSGRCFEFMTPTRYTAHLKEAGFNVVSLANNHSLDCGTAGIASTLNALNGSDIAGAGGESVALFRVGGKNLAVVAFSFAAHKYSHSILDIEEARKRVSALKQQYDLVIVSFHGGAEGAAAQRVRRGKETFLGEARGDVVGFSRAVIDAGADLVLGHGPHVLRAIEIYRQKLIAYSLGNFLTYGMFNLKGPSGVSVILRVNLDATTGNFAGGDVIPLKLLNGGIPSQDPQKEAITLLQGLIKTDTGDSGIALDQNGRLAIIKY
jgi:hypothetical protein